MFGISWLGIIALHKTLTLKRDDLLLALEIIDTKEKEQRIEVLRKWTMEQLLESSLGLNQESISHCKSIIGLINGHAASFDYIATHREISSIKASYIKTLVISK